MFTMLKNINKAVVRAIAKRDLKLYFSNPSGYVFITLFILLSAAAAFWQDRFFLNNLANLDQLNALFPYLLVFFVPALTMAVWAEERRQGTDELLFTLPATEIEVVLGKYVAVLGIYTVSLLLSLSHVLVLIWLGSPDLGLMFSNYLGYWLIGAALIAVGMLASLLTNNVTISFIFGALLSSTFVMLRSLADLFGERFARMVEPLGVFPHFRDFGDGVISLTGLLYFLGVAALFLYLNVVLVSRRHWPKKVDGLAMETHHLIRAISIFAIIIASIAIVARLGLRVDATGERLHSLSSETKELLRNIPDDRPVFIQAFVSPEVPEQLVQTRSTLLSRLRELAATSRGRVQIFVRDTEPFTEEAREARERFGIEPRPVPNLGSARAGVSEVFMGLAFTSGAEEQVIPFFDRGLPAEYELVRSIRVVANAERKKIGVVTTQLKIFGGLDFQTMQSSPAWSVVEELRKQYEVVQINPASQITDEVDGLMVALPSSLTQQEMDNVLAKIQAGTPTLLLVDPLPVINMGLAPSADPAANQNPFMQQQQAPPPPKGDVRTFMQTVGFRWDPALISWDAYNPHPDLAQLPPEVVFLGEGNENPDVFNPESAASSGLQQVVMLYPGTLESAAAEGVRFRSLMQTGEFSGVFPYFQMVQRSFFGVQLNQRLPHRPDPMTYTLAAEARKTSSSAAAATESEDAGNAQDSDGDGDGNGDDSLHVIAIADLDFISEQFFEIRRIGPPNLNFDNVSFFLNAMDVLVGDGSFVTLRNRRVEHRTLSRVEDQTRAFIEERTSGEQQAEQEAQQALDEAQRRLDERVAEVQNRSDIDAQAKQIMARNLQEVENRKFEVLKSNIERDKEREIRISEERMETQIRRIQSGIRTLAVALPPIPVFLLGVYIFFRRQQRENEGAAAARRLKEV